MTYCQVEAIIHIRHLTLSVLWTSLTSLNRLSYQLSAWISELLLKLGGCSPHKLGELGLL